jgi:hypothetical protein
MLCRWDVKAYDIGLLMAALDYFLDLMSFGEGIFGALTVEFGDRLKTRREESTKTRILLRIIIYCLKIQDPSKVDI